MNFRRFSQAAAEREHVVNCEWTKSTSVWYISLFVLPAFQSSQQVLSFHWCIRLKVAIMVPKKGKKSKKIEESVDIKDDESESGSFPTDFRQ